MALGPGRGVPACRGCQEPFPASFGSGMMPQPLGGGRGFREVGSPPHMPTQVLFFNGNKVYSKAHPVCCVRACGPQANCPQTPFAQASRVPLLPRAVLAVWEHLDSRTLKGRRPLGALDLAPRRTRLCLTAAGGHCLQLRSPCMPSPKFLPGPRFPSCQRKRSAGPIMVTVVVEIGNRSGSVVSLTHRCPGGR